MSKKNQQPAAPQAHNTDSSKNWRKPSKQDKASGLPGGPKSIRMLVGIFAMVALVFFVIGYVYLIRAYEANGSSPAMAYIFLVINTLELAIFPWITTIRLKHTKFGYYKRFIWIWAVILAVQIVTILIQSYLSTPAFLFVPAAMIVRNVKDWWSNAGDVDIVAYDYALYNMFFVVGDIFAVLTSIAGIIAPLYQKRREK